MSRLEDIGFPGAGTMVLPAEEARAFTVHEFAKPRLKDLEEALERNGNYMPGDTRRYVEGARKGLAILLSAYDRPVTADDLTWAATARCRCGAGFCYPNFTADMHGSWFCSAIVLGTAPAGSEHDKAKPFTFWSIKSDQQPSANGATTRPGA